MNSSNPENTPARFELEHLTRLEAIVQHSLASEVEVEVGNALAEISDKRLYRGTHPTFEMYLRERWGMNPPRGYQLIQAAESADRASADLSVPLPAAHLPARPLAPLGLEGAEALAGAWEQARHQFGGDEVIAVDIQLTIRKRQPLGQSRPEPPSNPGRPAESAAVAPLLELRWLLTQSSGTIADAVHQLESHAADLDDDAREQLRSDLLVFDEELTTLKALLIAPTEWDAEYGRLLAGEIPPFEDDPENEVQE